MAGDNMTAGSRRLFLGVTLLAIVCLLSAVVAARQVGPAPPAADRVPMTEQAFKYVTLLRGIPVDTFFEAMGMFASAMGNDLHVLPCVGRLLRQAAFAQPTPRIMRARQMIVMMNAINKQYFGGQPRVTCYTCHSGNQSPKKEPDLALQYGVPVEDPNAMEFPVDPRMTADQVFDKYIQALGGADRLAKLTSFTAKGTYSGIRHGVRQGAGGAFRQGSRAAGHGRAYVRRRQRQDVRRPQRLDGGAGHAGAAGDTDRRESGPREARGDAGVSSGYPAGVQPMARRPHGDRRSQGPDRPGHRRRAAAWRTSTSTSPACWCGWCAGPKHPSASCRHRLTTQITARSPASRCRSTGP